MGTIRTAIAVQDMASSVFTKIHSGITKTVTGFKNLNSEMSVAPTKSINNAEKLTQSALQTELAYQSELQVLKQVESEARKIVAAQGTQTTEAQEIIASVQEQRNLVQNLKNDYDNVSDSIKKAQNNQEELNNSMNTASSNGSSLLSKIKNIALTAGGIVGVKKLFDLSDDMTSISSRLDLIVDDNGSVQDLENKIFASAMRSRGVYQDTADMIGKLGTQAKGAFKSNDELIAFSEQLNKNFILAGTSQQGIASAQLQITQALASGVLRGEELNAVFENATPIIQKIADYLEVDIGEIRGLAAEGKLSAQIVKNALLSSADETNAQFEKMPMTWSQIWTKAKNIAVKSLEPVLKKINELANNQRIQQMFIGLINGAGLVAQAILGLIEGISWFISVLEPVAPIILGVVAAYVAFNIISGITSGILGIMATRKAIDGAASMLQAGKTMTATVAQHGLNAAMLACPITWIIIAIVALIAILTYWWFTNDKVAYGILYAWDALRIGIMVVGLGIQMMFYDLRLGLLALKLGFEVVCLGIQGVFNGLGTRNTAYSSWHNNDIPGIS